MTTWTTAVQQAETWIDETTIRMFSPRVFSHASYNGEFVFSMNPRGGVWDAETSTPETWTVQA